MNATGSLTFFGLTDTAGLEAIVQASRAAGLRGVSRENVLKGEPIFFIDTTRHALVDPDVGQALRFAGVRATWVMHPRNSATPASLWLVHPDIDVDISVLDPGDSDDFIAIDSNLSALIDPWPTFENVLDQAPGAILRVVQSGHDVLSSRDDPTLLDGSADLFLRALARR